MCCKKCKNVISFFGGKVWSRWKISVWTWALWKHPDRVGRKWFSELQNCLFITLQTDLDVDLKHPNYSILDQTYSTVYLFFKVKRRIFSLPQGVDVTDSYSPVGTFPPQNNVINLGSLQSGSYIFGVETRQAAYKIKNVSPLSLSYAPMIAPIFLVTVTHYWNILALPISHYDRQIDRQENFFNHLKYWSLKCQFKWRLVVCRFANLNQKYFCT